ncbi:MAG: hypothetical protein KME26_33870 [Oscillatoria princeps RMCB-10]|nr:hypothetical protein [Oscillatoria princeps RMCB-10]
MRELVQPAPDEQPFQSGTGGEPAANFGLRGVRPAPVCQSLSQAPFAAIPCQPESAQSRNLTATCFAAPACRQQQPVSPTQIRECL